MGEEALPPVNRVLLLFDAVKVEFGYGVDPHHALPLRQKILALSQVRRASIADGIRTTYLNVRPAEGTQLSDLHDLLTDLLRPRAVLPTRYHATTSRVDLRNGLEYICAAFVFDTAPENLAEIIGRLTRFTHEYIGECVVLFSHPRAVIIQVTVVRLTDITAPQLQDAAAEAGLDVTERIAEQPTPVSQFKKMIQRRYKLQ